MNQCMPIIQNLSVFSSVVDPNTLNLDPDPGFWPNLDPDPGLQYRYASILKEKIKFFFREKQFFISTFKN